MQKLQSKRLFFSDGFELNSSSTFQFFNRLEKIGEAKTLLLFKIQLNLEYYLLQSRFGDDMVSLPSAWLE